MNNVSFKKITIAYFIGNHIEIFSIYNISVP